MTKGSPYTGEPLLLSKGRARPASGATKRGRTWAQPPRGIRRAAPSDRGLFICRSQHNDFLTADGEHCIWKLLQGGSKGNKIGGGGHLFTGVWRKTRGSPISIIEMILADFGSGFKRIWRFPQLWQKFVKLLKGYLQCEKIVLR